MALGDIKHNIEEQAKKEAGGIRESASKEARCDNRRSKGEGEGHTAEHGKARSRRS